MNNLLTFVFQSPAPAPATPISDLYAFLGIVFGVVLSVAVPVAYKTLKPATGTAEGVGETISWFASVLKPYLKIAGASLVLGFLTLLVVKYTGGSFKNWIEAVMTGYLWDSTVQKVRDNSAG